MIKGMKYYFKVFLRTSIPFGIGTSVLYLENVTKITQFLNKTMVHNTRKQ